MWFPSGEPLFYKQLKIIIMYGLFIYDGYEWERLPRLVEAGYDKNRLIMEGFKLEKKYSKWDEHFGNLEDPNYWELSKHNSEQMGWVVLDLEIHYKPDKWFAKHEESKPTRVG